MLDVKISADYDCELSFSEKMQLEKHLLKSKVYFEHYNKEYFMLYKISKSIKRNANKFSLH